MGQVKGERNNQAKYPNPDHLAIPRLCRQADPWWPTCSDHRAVSWPQFLRGWNQVIKISVLLQVGQIVAWQVETESSLVALPDTPEGRAPSPRCEGVRGVLQAAYRSLSPKATAPRCTPFERPLWLWWGDVLCR